MFQRKVGKLLEPTTPGGGRKIPQMQANVGVHRESKSLWRHLGLSPMLLCQTEATGRRGKLTHGFAPELRNRWFDFHSDQIRVLPMNIKLARKLG